MERRAASALDRILTPEAVLNADLLRVGRVFRTRRAFGGHGVRIVIAISPDRQHVTWGDDGVTWGGNERDRYSHMLCETCSLDQFFCAVRTNEYRDEPERLAKNLTTTA